MSRRHQASNEDSYLSAGRPSNLLRTSFNSAKLESLYRASSLQQRRGGLECFLLSALLYGAHTIASPGLELLARGLTAVFLGLNLGLLAWAEHNPRAKDALWSVIPHVAWKLYTAQLLAQLFLKSNDVTPRDGLGWLLLLLYLLFATLPLRLSLCALLSFGTALAYVVTVVGLSKAPAQIPIDVLVGCRPCRLYRLYWRWNRCRGVSGTSSSIAPTSSRYIPSLDALFTANYHGAPRTPGCLPN